MINLKAALREDIEIGLRAAQDAGEVPVTEKPLKVVVTAADNEHGDYASPIALAVSKLAKKPPLDVVAAIVNHMPKREYVGKIDAAAPGFLNIRINPGWFSARLDDVIEHDICGDILVGRGKRVNLEFISANPTGPMTLGNTRTAFSVDTLGNVLACAGYNVTREYYINDAGAQIRKLGESVLRRMLELKGVKVDFPEELYQGEYIKDIAQVLLEEWRENEGRTFTEADLTSTLIAEEVSARALAMMMAAIRKTVKADLKIQFDSWVSEAALRASRVIEKVLERLRERKATYTKDGAEYLRTTEHGDTEDRVLVKKDGQFAYVTPDIAYHQDKYDRGFDLIFTFVGADHQAHGPKLKAAMKILGNDVEKLHIVAAQLMRFVSGGKQVKLSKRAGNIITPKDLIDEVGYDAARFFMVQHALTTHLDFDLDLAKERSERNPVYYIQYAYVRMQSIIRKAKEEGVLASLGDSMVLTSRSSLTHTAEINLMRQLYRLPEVVADVATNYEVQALAYYALELAKRTHFFYKHAPVLSVEDQALLASRLQLVMATRKVLAQTLDLLGLSKPEVM